MKSAWTETRRSLDVKDDWTNTGAGQELKSGNAPRTGSDRSPGPASGPGPMSGPPQKSGLNPADLGSDPDLVLKDLTGFKLQMKDWMENSQVPQETEASLFYSESFQEHTIDRDPPGFYKLPLRLFNTFLRLFNVFTSLMTRSLILLKWKSLFTPTFSKWKYSMFSNWKKID